MIACGLVPGLKMGIKAETTFVVTSSARLVEMFVYLYNKASPQKTEVVQGKKQTASTIPSTKDLLTNFGVKRFKFKLGLLGTWQSLVLFLKFPN